MIENASENFQFISPRLAPEPRYHTMSLRLTGTFLRWLMKNRCRYHGVTSDTHFTTSTVHLFTFTYGGHGSNNKTFFTTRVLKTERHPAHFLTAFVFQLRTYVHAHTFTKRGKYAKSALRRSHQCRVVTQQINRTPTTSIFSTFTYI